MKVLHITEAFGGGVTSAINTYVNNSMQFEHYLFATVRNDDATGEEGEGGFKKTYLVKRKLNAFLELRRVLKEIKPDVIHLHSSFAGAICRLLPFIQKDKVVYTPHAFAFLRKQHPLILRVYYYIEKLLARRAQIIAGCGRDEMLIAQQFMEVENTIELINICDPIVINTPHTSDSKHPIVSMLGRVSKQKGYDYFAEVARILKGHAKFVWIGGGDEIGEDLLKKSGVVVTGWASRSDVLKQLADADLYLHTAAWDGFPISVLEAAELGLPIILREIGPFSAEDLMTVHSPADAAKKVMDFISGSEGAIKAANQNSIDIRSYHTVSNLQASLNALYLKFKEV